LKLFYKRLPLAIVLAFLIFLPPANSSGKVFWSRLLAKNASMFNPAGNWTKIYKGPMTINGGRAVLSVYGCDDPLPSVTAELKRNFSANNKNHLASPGFTENSAQFSSSDSNQVARLLMLGMPGKDQSVIFELIQPPQEISKPPAPPAESVVFGRSLPAESALTATIKNEETGATLETLLTGLPPEQAGNALSERLSRDGWKDISPNAGHDRTPGYFRIYQRKNALCTIMVGQAAARAGQALRENKTCVTILFKEINQALNATNIQ